MTTTDTRQFNVETVVWMQPVKDIATGETGLVTGHVTNLPNTLAVVVKNDKCSFTRFYCQMHHRIYAVMDTCPSCSQS